MSAVHMPVSLTSTRRGADGGLVAVLLVVVTCLAMGCEPSIDRGTTRRAPEPAPAREQGRTVVGGSGSSLGKARDAAQRTVDDVEAQQRRLERQAEEIGGD